MADTAAVTNPAAPGTQTSEHTLTIVALVIGTLMDASAALMHSLQDAGLGASWFAMAFALMGTLTQIAALFGYTKSRTILKSALMVSDAPTNPKTP